MQECNSAKGLGKCEVGPVRERYVPAQMDSLSRAIDGLEGVFESLHDRLGVVRRNDPLPSQTAKEKIEVQEINCEIAERIRQQTKRVINLRDRIEFEIETLEV